MLSRALDLVLAALALLGPFARGSASSCKISSARDLPDVRTSRGWYADPHDRNDGDNRGAWIGVRRHTLAAATGQGQDRH